MDRRGDLEVRTAGNTKRMNSRGDQEVTTAGNTKRKGVMGNKKSEQLGIQREE